MKESIRCALALAALAAFLAFPSHILAQGTAVTYQGQLSFNGAPLTGLYDFTFTGYTTNSGGLSVAGPVTNLAVTVSNGLFTTVFDFGSYASLPTWLEIWVRTNNGGAFRRLVTRQQLTPTPYAVTAENASNSAVAQTVSGPVPATQITGSLGAAQLPAGVLTGSYTYTTNTLSAVATNGGSLVTNTISYVTSNLTLSLPTTISVATVVATNGSVLQTNSITNFNSPNLGLGVFANLALGMELNGYWNQVGNIFCNPNHGPDYGQPELQILGSSRMSLLAGYDGKQNGAIQYGSYPPFPGRQYAERHYWTVDLRPTSTEPLGYGKLLQFDTAYNNNGEVETVTGFRTESADTNGNMNISWYNPVTVVNPTGTTSPGNKTLVMGYHGLAYKGTLDHMDVNNLTLFSSDYFIDMTKAPDIISPLQNLNFVVTNYDTNYAMQTKEIFEYAGLVNITNTYPANWNFEDKPAITVVTNNTLLHTILTIQSAGSFTNYIVSQHSSPFPYVSDQTATQFFSNVVKAGGTLTLSQSNAVNQFCLAGRNGGWLGKLLSFKPFVSGVSGNPAILGMDLINPAYNFTWSGAFTYYAQSVTGSGSGNVADSHFVASTFTNASNALVFVYVSAPTNDGPGYINGASFFGYFETGKSLFGYAAGQHLYAGIDCPDSSATTFTGLNADSTNFSGFLGLNIVNGVETAYVNSTPTGGRNPFYYAAAASDQTVKFWGNGYNGVYGGWTYTSCGIGQGFTSRDVNLLVNAIANLNTALGR